MKERSPRNRMNRALAILAAATPFGFALIRAVRTGHDVRYIWVALAAFCGAMATMAIARPYGSRPNAAVTVSTGVFLSATLLAVIAALLLGTTLGPGILVQTGARGGVVGVSGLATINQGTLSARTAAMTSEDVMPT